jgi:ATP-dependent helicase/nuclease subunit A
MATRLENLSPEQRRVVETWDRGVAVLAGAGSGKTTTLVIKCEELVRRDPEARFAAVSFTERSAADLREKLALRFPLTGHRVATIHGLCASVIREYPREAGFDGEETMLTEPEAELLWERAVEGLWRDDLPDGLARDLDALLARESREATLKLLRRVRSLGLFGLLSSLEASSDSEERALARAARFALERYERLKRRRGVLDFNDLERGAGRALGHEAVRRAYHRRFALLLVDEFQDTNQVQAEILWKLARPDLSNLCVVGDPKQSIYRFRDADVSVFEAYRRRLPEQLSLTWNFRSRPGVIELANRACAPAFEASGMEYEALVARREAGTAFAPAERMDARGPEDLAAWVRGESARGVPLEDMALLLRTIRGGNEKWLRALTAAGIPIAIGSGGFFWEDPRARELVALLKWWCNPGNTYSGAVFLRAPWVGVGDAELDTWIRGDGLRAGFLRSGHPLARALARFDGRVARPGELLLALLVDEAVEAELGAPLLGLWHRAEELASRGLGFEAVAHELALSIEEDRREREVPPPRNLGQLRVLTIHGSKGLEFPHVILVDLPEAARPLREYPLLYWDREHGARLASRDAAGELVKTGLDAEWREREKAKELAESKRLFYVALTRARERLVLVCPAPGPTARPVSERAREIDPYTVDHWRGWVERSGAEMGTAVTRELLPVTGNPLTVNGSRVTGDRLPVTGNGIPPIPLRRPRHSVTELNLLQRCPRAYEWTYIRPRPVAEGVRGLGLYTGARPTRESETELTRRELGTRVHACLETGDYDGLRALEREAGADRFQAEPVVSWATSSPLMAPPREGRRRVWTELAFEAPVGDEAIVGALDRLVAEDGRYTLVDFKVTEKAKSVDALVETYRGQLALYAWALARLEPEAEGRTEALLVNISSRTIQTVPVPVASGDGAIEALVSRAARVVAGEPAAPTPGALCRVCEFRPLCPEGRAAN